MKIKPLVLPEFPEFYELKLSDRDAYNALIRDYPPISEISFSSLMSWWSSLGNCKVSQIHGNLVISYWLPGDDENSGLSLVGTNKIDESICEIFDYQKAQDQESKLVHVPDFVLGHIRYPEMFGCEDEPDYVESLLLVEETAEIKSMPIFLRIKVGSFLRATKGKRVDLKKIDLSKPENRELIINCYFDWKEKAEVNCLPSHAENAFLYSINNATKLGTEVVSLYIDDEINSFSLYESPLNSNYKVIKYSGFTFDVPGSHSFACYKMAELFTKENAKFVNMVIHIGDPKYRAHLLSLRPKNAFKKYTVRPEESYVKSRRYYGVKRRIR